MTGDARCLHVPYFLHVLLFSSLIASFPIHRADALSSDASFRASVSAATRSFAFRFPIPRSAQFAVRLRF